VSSRCRMLPSPWIMRTWRNTVVGVVSDAKPWR
jgi:hypothetical protein